MQTRLQFSSGSNSQVQSIKARRPTLRKWFSSRKSFYCLLVKERKKKLGRNNSRETLFVLVCQEKHIYASANMRTHSSSWVVCAENEENAEEEKKACFCLSSPRGHICFLFASWLWWFFWEHLCERVEWLVSQRNARKSVGQNEKIIFQKITHSL